MERKKPKRHRCANCRAWFTPHHAASDTQKTCSAECRRAYLNAKKRRRREQDIDESRRNERLRQRKSRERRKKEQKNEGEGLPVTTVSRTGLGAELYEIIDQYSRILDRDSDMSRTTLRVVREKILKSLDDLEARNRQELGQDGPEKEGCHGPG